ncbi:hypothetical protein D3C72_1892310 [compost metagenome]
MFLPAPGVTPRMRKTFGFLLFNISSTFFCVTPYSSASCSANKVQRTMPSQFSSPWRTMGPSGSFENRSGRIS